MPSHKETSLKKTKNERTSNVDEGALVDQSLFITEILPRLDVPNFKAGDTAIQWWIHVDSCLRSTNPPFVAFRNKKRMGNRVNVPAG